MLNLIPFLFVTFRWLDAIDIVLVAVLLYQLYYLVKGTVAINIFVGILLVYVLWMIVKALDMQLFGNILGKFIDVGVIVLIIVFQQELRRFLLFIGTTDFFNKKSWGKGLFYFKWQVSNAEKTDVGVLVKALQNMAEAKTGAILVITTNSELKFYINTGDSIEAKISVKLLESIFYKNSPLHDGAVIITGNTIKAARCILPVTEDINFPSHLGMRHRAAVGITENSDALAIIVSEQTGEISFAKEGQLRNGLSYQELRELMEKELG
jgi:diadenylate cyclase